MPTPVGALIEKPCRGGTLLAGCQRVATVVGVAVGSAPGSLGSMMGKWYLPSLSAVNAFRSHQVAP